jgi:hypothetical protein
MIKSVVNVLLDFLESSVTPLLSRDVLVHAKCMEDATQFLEAVSVIHNGLASIVRFPGAQPVIPLCAPATALALVNPLVKWPASVPPTFSEIRAKIPIVRQIPRAMVMEPVRKVLDFGIVCASAILNGTEFNAKSPFTTSPLPLMTAETTKLNSKISL